MLDKKDSVNLDQIFRRSERYDLQVDRAISVAEGNFIAGFIEGEGHFGIAEANGGQSFRCLMSLRVRDDDAELLEWLRARTGVGLLRTVTAQGNSNPQVQWLVQTQAGCRTLVELLTRFEMRGRKTREFAIWRRAVALWTSDDPSRVSLAEGLHRELSSVRRFQAERSAAPPAPVSVQALHAYLHGFLCAEGSLSLDRTHTALTVHLRQDDRPLLKMLYRELGVGALSDHPAYGSTRPSTSWRVGRLAEVSRLAEWLDPAQMRGRKANELEVWSRAVAERRAAREQRRRANLDDLIAEFRSARTYRPGVLLQPSRHSEDRRAETLRILRVWAEEERGLLSCARYAAARRAGWPTRNTIAQRFGSWDAALRTAGLEARLPRPAPRQVGGVARRKAHDEAQRERVLATLRYGVNLHGSLPTAMQFFRWRLVEAPATPTQATVYRLFPGGWPAVLAAYEASADQPSRSRVARGSFSTTRS
jgi:hypothetical protein